jgi:hypothetical protein
MPLVTRTQTVYINADIVDGGVAEIQRLLVGMQRTIFVNRFRGVAMTESTLRERHLALALTEADIDVLGCSSTHVKPMMPIAQFDLAAHQSRKVVVWFQSPSDDELLSRPVPPPRPLPVATHIPATIYELNDLAETLTGYAQSWLTPDGFGTWATRNDVADAVDAVEAWVAKMRKRSD